MPHNETHMMSGWNGELIFGQLYHTPVSEMVFWSCGIANGDWFQLSPWFQEIYSVEATFNSQDYMTTGKGRPVNVFISGTAQTVILPYFTSGYKVNYHVFGHKAECGSAFD